MVDLLRDTEGVPAGRWGIVRGFYERIEERVIVHFPALGTVLALTIDAVEKLMRKMGVQIDHFDLIEANEAFAAQAVADGKALGWDWDRVNVNGGAVALGHPIGASGARVLTTLLYALRARNAATGLATLCLGGGNAVALSVERLS